MNQPQPWDHRKFRVDGRQALVTGASAGIGRAISLGLAEMGADLILHAHHDDRIGVDESAHAANALGAKVRVETADFTVVVEVEQLAMKLRRDASIGIFISNVGLQVRAAFGEMTLDDINRQAAANIVAPVRLIQALLPAMVRAGWGRILTIGSIQQAKPNPLMPAYAATKAAMENLVRNLAVDVARKGVTVNNLAPGVIETMRTRDVLADPERLPQIKAAIPAQRIGRAGDCVGPALMLCSDAGAYITGSTIFVDGGMHL